MTTYIPERIDSILVLDTTIIDSTIIRDTMYDTVPGIVTIDSNRRADSAFLHSGISMNYVVQLIHTSGHIDTIERLKYDPYDSIYIFPMTVNIDHANDVNDTVMLRVVGTMTGIPDADSDAEFDRETMLDTYPSWGDTTVAVDTSGLVYPPDTCFYAMGPYSNPSEPSEQDVSILVHYCASGSPISARVYTLMGVPMSPATTVTSDGQAWDKIPITAPGTSGSYYIQVTVGGYSTSLGYTVF